jgi:hypothetical protein
MYYSVQVFHNVFILVQCGWKFGPCRAPYRRRAEVEYGVGQCSEGFVSDTVISI